MAPLVDRPRRSIHTVPGNGRGSRGWRWFRPVRVSIAAQQEADRQAGERLVSLLDPAGKAEVDDLLARGEAIHAIRRVRELTGLRLIDAKRLVDSLRHPSAHSGGMTNVPAWKSWWQSSRTVGDAWAGKVALGLVAVYWILFFLRVSSGWFDAFGAVWMIYAVAFWVHVVVVHRRDRRSSEGSGISPSSR